MQLGRIGGAFFLVVSGSCRAGMFKIWLLVNHNPRSTFIRPSPLD